MVPILAGKFRQCDQREQVQRRMHTGGGQGAQHQVAASDPLDHSGILSAASLGGDPQQKIPERRLGMQGRERIQQTVMQLLHREMQAGTVQVNGVGADSQLAGCQQSGGQADDGCRQRKEHCLTRLRSAVRCACGWFGGRTRMKFSSVLCVF
ncbi:hypothetical protein [Leisingera methylohalidivorans]|uniref:hypothetical protein n=1 Tax=Leisingera methylohalidivorans TaxID=133924 RepID=UPI0012EBCEC1|nr:hypothetical protein [Leisingera methylohalidivorans]